MASSSCSMIFSMASRISVMRRSLRGTFILSRSYRARVSSERIDLRREPEQDDLERLPHTPVLVQELLQFFEGRTIRTFVDCTVGAGGHSFEMTQAHPELETLVAFDADREALELAKQRLRGASSNNLLQVHFVHTNFRHIKKRLEAIDPELLRNGVDAIVMDLGLSSMQVDTPRRGFSYYLDGPLDMRTDQSDPFALDAATILRDWPESEIRRILRVYGEEPRCKYIARRLVNARLDGGVRTTKELVDLIGGPLIRGGKHNFIKHPAAKTFQALRIAVNDELEALKLAMTDACTCLAPGGRLAVISFHSLEDRIVKYHFREVPTMFEKKDFEFRILTPKPIVPGVEDMDRNKRCRSAKMRVIQRMNCTSGPIKTWRK